MIMLKVVSIKIPVLFPIGPYHPAVMDQMKGMDFQILVNDETLCKRCLLTTNPEKGLLTYKQFPINEFDGMLFNGAIGFHSKEMKFPFDLIYINGLWRITTLHSNIQPDLDQIPPVDIAQIMVNMREKTPLESTMSTLALELPVGTIKSSALDLGMTLNMSAILKK
jgi:uncharacterized membrane protein (UPF0127 family)